MSPKVPRHLRHPHHPRRSPSAPAIQQEADTPATTGAVSTEAEPSATTEALIESAAPETIAGELDKVLSQAPDEAPQEATPETVAGELEEAPDWLIIGQVIAPFGLRGELRIKVITDFPERFKTLTQVYIGRTKREYQPFPIRSSRWHQGELLLSLPGVDDVNAAQNFRGDLLVVPRRDAVQLPPGHYFLYQLIGLRVSTLSGEELGKIIEVLQTGANDVYVVSGKGGTVLIPATKEIVKSIDLAAGQMSIDPLPGLLDDMKGG